jgi:hypothetical protein
MGCFSFRCAKTHTSIPVEHHNGKVYEVVGLYPNGKKVRGVYDGQGWIGSRDYIKDIMSMPAYSEFEYQGFERKQGNRIDVKFSYRDTQGNLIHSSKDYELFKPAMNDQEVGDYALSRLYWIKQELQWDANASSIKIVRADFYKPRTDKFDSLPPSQPCPFQGLLPDDHDFMVDARLQPGTRGQIEGIPEEPQSADFPAP